MNLATPPQSLYEITTLAGKFLSLIAFIEDFEWDYAALDIVDRHKIKHFSLETFWSCFGESVPSLEKPRRISPITAVKRIVLGTELVGVFLELRLEYGDRAKLRSID